MPAGKPPGYPCPGPICSQADPRRRKRPAVAWTHKELSRSSMIFPCFRIGVHLRSGNVVSCPSFQKRSPAPCVVNQRPLEGEMKTESISASWTAPWVTSSTDWKRTPSKRSTPLEVVSQRYPSGDCLMSKTAPSPDQPAPADKPADKPKSGDQSAPAQ